MAITEEIVLLGAKSGTLGPDIGRVICMANGQRVRAGIEDMNDDQGGPSWPGRWKKGRSS